MATSNEALESQRQTLLKQFLGTSLRDAPVPSAVLDLSTVKRNCTRMLDDIESLGFGWRAHIKTHKTTELTALQLGSTTRTGHVLTSTLNEAESILPLLLTYPVCSLLYGFPLYPSAAPRLAALSTALGPNRLMVLVDHPDQIATVETIYSLSNTPISVVIKIEMGSQRAGVRPESPLFAALVSKLPRLIAEGKCDIGGLYSHAGHSYYGNDPATAIGLLNDELSALLEAAAKLREITPFGELTLSVGATPTTTAVRNLQPESHSPATAAAITTLQATIAAAKNANTKIELHAGVYPLLDIQQLSTHALPSSLLSWEDIGITILAEVASLYPEREHPEALITAGSIALGREPCKAYPGYGVLTPWGREGVKVPAEGPEGIRGWIIRGVSQEHGVLRWVNNGENEEGKLERDELKVGQRVKVWPNHACIAGTGYDWYLVVDGGDEVVDVWMRWRGW